MDKYLITQVTNPKAELPKSDPLVAPKADIESLCDPRALLLTESVAREEVSVGDWIAAQGWSRARRVMAMEEDVMFLLDPDSSRTNDHGIRRLDAEGWDKRGSWRSYPNLRKVWEAAHSQCGS